MLGEPEAVRRRRRTGSNSAGNQIAGGHRRRHRIYEQWHDTLGHGLEQLAGVIAVFEAAVQHQPQPRVEFGPLGLVPEHEAAHHKARDADQRLGRGLQCGEFFQRRIALAAGVQDLAVERLLGREVPEQQRFGNARRLGDLAGGRAGEAVPREQRHRRVDDRLAALFGVEPGTGHARRSKRLLTSGQGGLRQRKKGSKKMGGLPPRPPIACVAWGCPIPPKGPDPATRRSRYRPRPPAQPENPPPTDLSPRKRTYSRYRATSPPPYPPPGRATSNAGSPAVRPSTARSARAQDEVNLYCYTQIAPHPEPRQGEAAARVEGPTAPLQARQLIFNLR